MALRSDREAASISKGELALTIAHEMRRYLVGSVIGGTFQCYSSSGHPQRSQYLSMKGTRINFDISIIYLTKLTRVSRGSWQPEFSVRRHDTGDICIERARGPKHSSSWDRDNHMETLDSANHLTLARQTPPTFAVGGYDILSAVTQPLPSAFLP
ncbi:hypothetical protein BD309DRAFT_356924 [Dichomitus squalens]|nr:hypothetical protein BD309DRAFT_356924 [Dichomitus squalens]